MAEKEAAETQYWLELFRDANMGDAEKREWLLQECGELLAILVASGRTAKANRQRRAQP